jgi:hypothetical protein
MNFIPTLIRAKMNDEDSLEAEMAEAITSTYEEYYSTLSRHGQQTVDTVRTVIHRLLSKKKRISDRVKMVALASALLVNNCDDKFDAMYFSILIFGQAGDYLYDLAESHPDVYRKIVARIARLLRKAGVVDVDEQYALSLGE